jgi:hypothetical protein
MTWKCLKEINDLLYVYKHRDVLCKIVNFWFISRFSLILINKSKTAYIMHGSLRYKEIICVQNYFSGS